MLGIVTAMVAAQLRVAELAARVEELEARPPEVRVERVETVTTEYVPYEVRVAEPAEWRECGTCGAHVTEWWSVRNDADTGWVDVCELCYLRMAAEDYWWPEGVLPDDA